MPAFADYAQGAGAVQDELLKALASTAATGTDASPLIKEDLEVEAHTQLYMETDPIELVLLKHIPRFAATSVVHQFDQIVGYGPRSHDGFYGENSLPAEAAIQSRRETRNIRLMGDISSVFALASFQTSIQALGASNLVDENMAATRLDLLLKMCREIYASDDSVTLHGLRFKGLKQQILEATSASGAAPYAPNPDYIVDLRGKKLLPEEIRKRAIQISKKHGIMRWIYMAPDVSGFLEETLDPAERLQIPRAPADEVLLGQNISGMHTAGGIVRFAVDNTLSPDLYRGMAPTSAVSGAPTPLPAGNIAAPAAAANGGSLWVAADAATVVYDITALNAFGESTPTRVGPVAVAVGQAVTIAITPRAADTSYRVYRGVSGSAVAPQFVAELKGTGNTTAFNYVDLNSRIPGTTEVFGLNINSTNNSIPALQSVRQGTFERIQLNNAALTRNTCSLATLGPWMGVFELAHILHTASRDLLFSAFTPQVTHPLQNIVWTNVGDRE